MLRRCRGQIQRAGRTTALLAAVVVVAACGGEDATSTGTPVSVAERGPGFEEVGQAAGLDFHMTFLAGEQGEKFKINLYDHGSGVSVGDADGDGREDLYFVNQLGPNALFRNNGDGTFEDITVAAGVVLADRIGTSAAFADIDNDGDQDLYVASVRGGNTLFQNEGGGHFTDVTATAGLTIVAHTQGATFFDYDADGYLDLYITNTAKWTMERQDPGGRYHVGAETLMSLILSKPEQNVLYHNEGDGTFIDVTARMRVGGSGWGGDTAVFDADGDGDQDLFVTNMFGANRLYRNEGGLAFTDIAEMALGRTSWGAVGCKPLDFDGDGQLDLFVVDMHSDMWMNFDMDPGELDAERRYAGPTGPMVALGWISPQQRDKARETLLGDPDRMRDVVFGNTLFRNLGRGRFVEVSTDARVETLWPWSVAVADFDQDGFEDVFLAAGMGYPYGPWPNDLLMNAGDGTFVKQAEQEGITPRPDGRYLDSMIAEDLAASSSRSAAVLDYDDDGRPDLVVNNFNERPYLYRNRFPARNWIGLRLRGTQSNRDAIGAVARLEIDGTTQVRQVCAAGGYLAQSTRTLYFGLGDADGVARCEVVWPNGSRQELTDLATGRLHDIVEPREDAR